jgi:hypothetical protein
MPFVLSRKPTIKCEATQDVPQAMPQFESPKNILTFPFLLGLRQIRQQEYPIK